MLPQEIRDEGTIWHLYWEAAVGRHFLPKKEFCGELRSVIVRTSNRARCLLVAYLALPQEIHVILVIARGGTAGEVARALGSAIGRAVNGAADMRSPAFARRYRAERIASIAELRKEMRFLAWRAVFLGYCRTPAAYPHSSLRLCLGLAAQRGFDVGTTLHLFSDSVIEARRNLRALLADRPSDEDLQAWASSRDLGAVQGRRARGARRSATNTTHANAQILLAASGGTTEGAIQLLEEWAAMKMGASSGAALISGRSRAAARGRGLVACIATLFGLCPAAFLRVRYGLAKSTMSEQMQRWRKGGHKLNGKADDGAATLALPRTPANQIIKDVNRMRARRPPTGSGASL